MFREQLSIIKIGSREEIEKAQKEIKDFFEENFREEKKLQEVSREFWKELDNFEEIEKVKNQIYFLDTLKWPLYSVEIDEIPKLMEFFLHLIQHQHGHIRQAVIRASNHLRFRLFVDFGSDIEKKKSAEEENKKLGMMFVYWVDQAERLLGLYDEPKYRRYKYIDSLPVGVYKSLHKLVAEVLLSVDYYKKIYRKLKKEAGRERAKIIKYSLPKIRKELDKILEGFLEKYKSQNSLADFKLAIYEEDSGKGKKFSDLIDFFDFEDVDMEETEFVVQVLQDAWNCFPHRSLDGKSPMEVVVLEY